MTYNRTPLFITMTLIVIAQALILDELTKSPLLSILFVLTSLESSVTFQVNHQR